MSQNPKKPGVRDISELKARLGLKKGATTGANKAVGGAIPPPHAAKVGSLPPPPGAAPQRPVIPDATQDPFAAMNAIAAHSAQSAAPQIVIVNDGKPVESVEHERNWVRYGKIAGVILAPLVIGVIIGQISSSAKVYNRTIEDAAKIRDDVKVVGRGLLNLKDQLLVAKERGPGGTNFLVNDQKLTTDLEALGLSDPEKTVVLHSYLYEMDPAVVEEVLNFYTETTLVYQQVRAHIAAAKQEAKAIAAGDDRIKKLNPTRFGAYVEIPSAEDLAKGAMPAVQFVELGLPLCQDGKPSAQGCPGTPKGFLYRPDEQGPWGPMELASVADGKISGKKLLVFGPTPALVALFKGSEATVSETSYLNRIRDIDTKVDDLIERRKLIEAKLNDTAQRGTKFTFFM